jgi:hypothetical protein
MTPEEQYALLRGKSGEIDQAVQAAYERLISLIDSGTDPRDAVDEVMSSFKGEFAKIYAAGLSTVLSESIGSASAVDRPIGRITLSQRLYSQAEATASVVRGVVERHRKGFSDSRQLARELFEGYGFRDEEVLTISRQNRRLPKYMRQALLDDQAVAKGFAREFARLQVKDLKTPELRTAYNDVLKGIDGIQDGPGKTHLQNKIRVAFYERVRYFSKRIAETELHRQFAEQQAVELMADDDIKYVQWRLSTMHPIEDICDYFAGVDLYGLGPGVYPKELAPVAPAHPFCKCVLSPLALDDVKPKPKENAEQEFYSRWSPQSQRRIAGSNKKLERVRNGESTWDVHNSGTEPEYQVKKAGSV